jgi:hypothetical protein
MDEYISRKAAIAYIREQSEECQKAFEELGGESGIYADAYNDLAEDFYSIPTADVAPVVHGRWIPSESDFDDDDTLFDVEEWCDWQCSACREDICYEDPMPPRLLPKHCPNCGAKMDGGDRDAVD